MPISERHIPLIYPTGRNFSYNSIRYILIWGLLVANKNTIGDEFNAVVMDSSELPNICMIQREVIKLQPRNLG